VACFCLSIWKPLLVLLLVCFSFLVLCSHCSTTLFKLSNDTGARDSMEWIANLDFNKKTDTDLGSHLCIQSRADLSYDKFFRQISNILNILWFVVKERERPMASWNANAAAMKQDGPDVNFCWGARLVRSGLENLVTNQRPSNPQILLERKEFPESPSTSLKCSWGPQTMRNCHRCQSPTTFFQLHLVTRRGQGCGRILPASKRHGRLGPECRAKPRCYGGTLS
jgi:hypothetical protein